MSVPSRCVVFIVDDDASVRKGLGRLMRSAGYNAEAFESAEAFLAHQPADLPACLILDFKILLLTLYIALFPWRGHGI